MNLIKEEDKIELLISNVSNIEYLPKYSIVKSKKHIERYLKCISNSELFEILRDIPELLKTVTIGKLLKNISAMDPSLSKINEILSNEEDKLSVDTILLANTDDKLLNELKMYLLTSATYSKDPYNEENYSKLAKNNVNWIDIVFDGGSDFDSIFDTEVDEILENRGSLTFVTPTIRMKLKKLKDNSKLIEAINHKMNDCTKNQRSLYEYITSDISWNKNDKCLVCPEEDCLIYIYNYYYGFLNDNSDNIPILSKIYMLILCEARIFILSKCIILEALRQESGDKSIVIEILNKIYERDKKHSYIKPNVPEQYTDFTLFKRPTQSGGELEEDKKPEEDKKLESSSLFGEESTSTETPSTADTATGDTATGDTATDETVTAPVEAGELKEDVSTGDIPTGDIPTGHIPTGDIPTGDVSSDKTVEDLSSKDEQSNESQSEPRDTFESSIRNEI